MRQPEPSAPSRLDLTRRRFLRSSLAAAGGVGLLSSAPGPAGAATGPGGRDPLPRRPPSSAPSVAAVVTEYRPWSHADVIVGRAIQGHVLDVDPHWAPLKLRALYIDQPSASDLGRAVARHHGVPIVSSIREAILDASGKLAVDGVLLIGEHGDYPYNERGQHLYPRRRFFEETLAAFEAAGEVAPVFNDKHLSARWEDASWMWRRARELGVPLLAGSSLPLAWRRPWLELPPGTPMTEALAVGYHDIEAYGFHALETLWCMIERRKGGESGVAAVECLEGGAVWEAMRAGRFSRDLVLAALSRQDPPVGEDFERLCPSPTVFLIEHTDGLRSACLIPGGPVSSFLFAARIEGQRRPVSSLFWLQEPGFGHFSYLMGAIARMVRTGTPPYPVERTVLTTGVLSFAMDSRFEGHRRIETPELAISYAAVDHDLGAHRHKPEHPERSGGWIDLLAGGSLDAFLESGGSRGERPEARWELSGGALWGSGEGDLLTLERFGDLELFAELRPGGATSAESALVISVDGRGVEARCDSNDPAEPPGSLREAGLGTRATAGARASSAPWRTLRLRLEGTRARVWIDGEEALTVEDLAPARAPGSLRIALRGGSTAQMRELRVRRLEP